MYPESTVQLQVRRARYGARGVVLATALLAVAFGVGSLAHPDQPLAQVAMQSDAKAAAPAAKVSDDASSLPDAQSDPRECDLTKGISSECVFE